VDGGGFKSVQEMYKAYMFPEIDKILQEIESYEGVDATEWCRQMLDPLHHKIMGRTPVGPPSKTREPVLVFADTVTIPISIPPAFDATLPWSFQAQFFPDTYIQEYVEYNRDQNDLTLLPGSVPRRYGGIIFTARQGSTFIQWSLPPASVTLLAQWGVGQALSNVKSKTMVVSLKIENNTPPLYAGGATHAARHNEGNSERTSTFLIQVAGTGSSAAVVQCTEEYSYPASPAEISFLPGYMDGDAIDGSMNVCCADVWEEAAVPDFTHTIFESNTPLIEPNTSNVIGPTVRPSTVDSDWGVPVYRNISSGLKPMQQWYVNVTPQSTFTARIDAITAAFYAPNIPGQIENISLLRASTPYCPKAMNLVSMLLRQAPAMGKAADNRNFSWLKKVVADSRGDISDILGKIPHPIAQGASMIWDAFKPQQVQAQQGFRANQNPTMPQPRTLTKQQNIHGPFAAAKYPTKTNRPKPVNQTYQIQPRPTVRTNAPPLPKYAANHADLQSAVRRERKRLKRARRRANSF